MSWLYSLNFYGAGTGRVEALSSYFIRLAQVHATTPGTLMALLLERTSAAGAVGASHLTHTALSSLIRPNQSTELLLKALGEGLGCSSSSLEQMTFMSLKGALDRPLSSFSPRLRWCPACIAAQIAAGEMPHYELAWQVLACENCTQHRVCLRDCCTHCASAQDSAQARKSLAECVKCGERLDIVAREDLVEESGSQEIVLLVDHVSTTPGFRFPEKAACRAVRELLDDAWAEEREDTLFKVLPRDECIRFADPNEPFTLATALRVAFRLNVPLVNLLSGQLKGTNRSILENAQSALPSSMAVRSRQRIPSAELIKRRMRELVRNADSPLALQDIAKHLRVSVGALRYRFPTEAQRISDLYLAARQARKDETLKRCRDVVARGLAVWESEHGGPLSRKKLLYVLRSQTGLPKNLLRLEIARAVAASTSSLRTGGVP